MIRVAGVKGQTFGIGFTHERMVLHGDGGKVSIPHTTACTIHLLDDNGKSIARWEGTAYCHANDQYKKETGRKIALTRAIYGLASQCSLNKEERAKFWDAYFHRKEQIPEDILAPSLADA